MENAKDIPGTPEWWLDRLTKAQAARSERMDVYEKYYNGEHRLAFASREFREAFGGLFNEFSDNWCETVVNAVEERLNVVGFRFGPSPEADAATWEIWQANRLDSEMQLAHTEALVHGESYTLVWPNPDGSPRVTVEHPSQMITACKAGDRRTVAAAMKRYVDDDDTEVAYLYLPDTVYRFRSERGARTVPGVEMSWMPDMREGTEDPAEQPNPFADQGIVPVVPIQNRPRLVKPPRSEIAGVIPMQDAVNKLWCDLFISSEFTADAQRWILGLEPDVDENGQPKDPGFDRRKRTWLIPQSEVGEHAVSVGQFTAGDPDAYLKAIEAAVQHIASQTRTPPHYLSPGADRLSGESIKSSESGLISKVRRKMVPFGESHEQTMRLCHILDGDVDKAGYVQAETVWANPEIRSESETADAASKRKEIGVPWRALMEFLGYGPVEIERMQAEKLQEELETMVLAAETAPVAPPAVAEADG